MRRTLLAAMVCGMALAAGCVRAQEKVSATAALKDGVVTVWVVTPGNDGERNRATLRALQKRVATGAVAPGYKESTTGSFGRPASEVGQPAGSYGQSAGSFGKNAGDVGQSAGSYGQSAGSVGKNASDVGQSAGSYGQSAGSFGQPASTYGQTLSGQSLGPVAKPASGDGRAVRNVERERAANGLGESVRSHTAARVVTVVGVAEEDLQDRLAAAQGSEGYPDVVLLLNIPLGWNEAGVGLTMLGRPHVFDAGDLLLRPEWAVFWPVVMVKAPHPLQARALVVWLRDQEYCDRCEGVELAKRESNAALVAAGALQEVLNGGGWGAAADVDAARFSGELARSLALAQGAPLALDGQHVRVDAMSARVVGSLAVVTLRGIVESQGAFGVVHGRAVLRKDERGRWKVLQLSPNLGPGRIGDQVSQLTAAAAPAKDGKVATLVAISQAAPVDGDNRSPQPDLWWDNGGEPSLMVVEWQRKAAAAEAWTDPRLMFLPSGSWHLQTRVTAGFADSSGAFRWRVWTVGAGGALILSPWRRLNIVQ